MAIIKFVGIINSFTFFIESDRITPIQNLTGFKATSFSCRRLIACFLFLSITFCFSDKELNKFVTVLLLFLISNRGERDSNCVLIISKLLLLLLRFNLLLTINLSVAKSNLCIVLRVFVLENVITFLKSKYFLEQEKHYFLFLSIIFLLEKLNNL